METRTVFHHSETVSDGFLAYRRGLSPKDPKPLAEWKEKQSTLKSQLYDRLVKRIRASGIDSFVDPNECRVFTKRHDGITTYQIEWSEKAGEA